MRRVFHEQFLPTFVVGGYAGRNRGGHSDHDHTRKGGVTVSMSASDAAVCSDGG